MIAVQGNQQTLTFRIEPDVAERKFSIESPLIPRFTFDLLNFYFHQLLSLRIWFFAREILGDGVFDGLSKRRENV